MLEILLAILIIYLIAQNVPQWRYYHVDNRILVFLLILLLVLFFYR